MNDPLKAAQALEAARAIDPDADHADGAPDCLLIANDHADEVLALFPGAWRDDNDPPTEWTRIVLPIADNPKVIAGPGHWYALATGGSGTQVGMPMERELVALPMRRDDDPADLPAHPDTLTDDQCFELGWYAVDFDTAFSESAEDQALVAELRDIEKRLEAR